MNRRRFVLMGSSALASALLPMPALARRYLSLEQAQKLMFVDQSLHAVEVTLTPEQILQIEQASGVPVRVPTLSAWRSGDGGWFLVDEVIGKHEFITWALALAPSGAVRQVEILDYRESYGGEVRNRRWREQFEGSTALQLPRFKEEIQNISGATLSCSHLTEGVRRLLATHDLVLKHLAKG